MIKNILFLTNSRVFCAYFLLSESDTVKVDNKVPWGSLRFSLTYGFGSVCLGSLFIPLIHLTLGWHDGGYIDPQGQRHGGCCGCKDWLLSRVNWFSWVHIAIYGKSISKASKDAWKSIVDHGVDTIIMPSLVNYFIKLSWISVGLTSAIASWLFLRWKLSFVQDAQLITIITLVSLVIGMVQHSVATVLIDSGLVSLAVVMSEEIRCVQRMENELFELMWERWPEVVSLVKPVV